MTPAASEDWSLTGDWFLYPTPAGAHFATSTPDDDGARRFLRRLLREPVTPRATAAEVAVRAGLTEDQALPFLHRMQESGLVQGLGSQLSAPPESLERLLPQMLAQLCDTGRALLAESRGLTIASAGFAHEVVEEVAVLAGELAALRNRHLPLVHNNLRVRATGWALVDAEGLGELGFWPLHIGREVFVLVVNGVPRFNQAAYTTLIWALSTRYDLAY